MKKQRLYLKFTATFLLLTFSLLLVVACAGEPAAPGTPLTPPSRTPTSTASPTASAGPVVIDLVAQNIAFDKSSLTVPAGAEVTINFNNRDSGIGHNFSVYTDESASRAIFQGQIIIGPSTTTYRFTAPREPGTYFFRCDPHPAQMNGPFVVQ